MSGALALTEPTLDEVLLTVLRRSRRRARTADCPVCGGAMRRLAEAGMGLQPGADELVCGHCASVLIDEPPPPAAQLRLVT
jgi:hypothetical protein